MDWDRIEKNWQQVKQKIKEKWERLSDADLDAINGRRERLEDKIHEHYGFAFGSRPQGGRRLAPMADQTVAPKLRGHTN